MHEHPLALRLATMAAVASLATATAAAADRPAIESLAWLSGCWHAQGGEAGTMEAWLPPAGETMLGIGRNVRGGKTIDYELMRIEGRADGGLNFIAKPVRQAEATFAAKVVSADEVVFENLEHDFPQRIIYRRTGADGLLGRIEGMRNGAARAIDFPYRRGSCESTR